MAFISCKGNTIVASMGYKWAMLTSGIACLQGRGIHIFASSMFALKENAKHSGSLVALKGKSKYLGCPQAKSLRRRMAPQ